MRADRILAIVGAMAAAIAAAIAALLPIYSSGAGSRRLSEVNGDWIFALVAALLVIAVIPIVAHERAFRWLAVLCGLVLIIGSFATVVGVFFLPSGLALVAAGAVARR